MDCRVEIPSVIDSEVMLPLSKSIAARVFIISALCGREKLEADGEMWNEAVRFDSIFPFCDDSEVLAGALASSGDRIDVGAAGTAMRFLTAYFACQEGRTVTLDGTERMRQRPVGPLVDALRQMGASIEYLGNCGFPPLKIAGRKLCGGHIAMRGDVSSQFISAVLMIAPLAGGITLTLNGDLVSRPYINMTLALMRHYGIEAHFTSVVTRPASSATIVVPAGNYVPTSINIEGDWSAASYWFALKALLPQSRIVLSPLLENSIQGDRAIVEMMVPLGVKAQCLEGDNVILPPSPTILDGGLSHDTENRSWCYERDMGATPDLVPTLAVTLCLLRVPFSLTGVATLRLKESDRLEALREELAKLGYSLEVGDDSLSYNGNRREVAGVVTLSPHGDHRLAMSLSLAATRHNIIIKDAEVVSKSYPGWWEQLINAQCTISQL